MKPLTEAAFLQMVRDLARLCGWLVYHPHDSRRSEAGFPDLLLLRGDVLLVAELKTDRGRLTPAQELWLLRFRTAGIPASVWRPRDWPLIQAALEG